MHKIAVAILLALGTLAQTAQAHVSSANVSASNFAFTLTDLNKSDNITPTLTFDLGSRISGHVSSPSESDQLRSYTQSQNGTVPVTNSASYTAASAHSSITPGSAANPYDGFSMSAGGYADQTGIFVDGRDGGGYTVSAEMGPAFSDTLRLSPYTKLTITFTASLATNSNLNNDYAHFSTAQAALYVNLDSSQDRLELSSLGVGSDSYSGLRTISFINNTGSYVTPHFGVYMVAYGDTSITTAVPEPETYAMLLAGLGLIAAVVRRRRA